MIVVSILLAFAVDAWWDGREDRGREAAFLEQLVDELESSLANNDLFGGLAAPSDSAAARLVQSYYEAAPPAADSVAYWFDALQYWVVQPQLGTLEMLVETGDLRLIRDGTLRRAIPGYLTSMRAFEGFQADGEKLYSEARGELTQHIDLAQIGMRRMSDEAREQALAANGLIPLATGPLRDLPPQDLVGMVREKEVHRVLSRLLDAKLHMRTYRQLMRRSTATLLEQVYAAQSN